MSRHRRQRNRRANRRIEADIRSIDPQVIRTAIARFEAKRGLWPRWATATARLAAQRCLARGK